MNVFVSNMLLIKICLIDKTQETLFVEGLLPQLFDSLCMLEKQSFRRRRSQAKECNLVNLSLVLFVCASKFAFSKSLASSA